MFGGIRCLFQLMHDFFDFERRPSQALLELFRKEESLTQMQVELIIMKKGAVALTENNR